MERRPIITHVTEMERRLEEAGALTSQLTAEQRQQLLALGDDLEQLWDHPRSPVTLKKRVLRTVLQEVIADTTDDPPSVRLKLHWAGGSHTELTVPKNRTGYHNHINSREVTELIRELALVCEEKKFGRVEQGQAAFSLGKATGLLRLSGTSLISVV